MNTEAQPSGVLMPVEREQRSSRHIAPTATGNALTPAALLSMAVSQGADLDRLERLMALQERFEANEARKAFVEAMTAFKAEPMEILKRKQVSFTTKDGDTTSYKHAELSDVTAAVVPAMARHGLSHRWNIEQTGTLVTVDCVITHAQGHSEKVTLFAGPDASGKKNAIQQIASTVTYLQRYTLLAACGLSTKGEDDDGKGGAAEFITAEEAATIQALIDDAGADKAKFLEFLKVDSIAHIAFNDYARAVGVLNEKKRKGAGK